MTQNDNSATPLIDEIYQKLYRAEGNALCQGFNKPKFQIYLTHQQRNQLRKEALATEYPVLTVNHSPLDSGEFLFGHKIIVVDETPYVRLMCDCIEKVNGLIKDKGERLTVNILFDGSPTRPFISTPTQKELKEK